MTTHLRNLLLPLTRTVSELRKEILHNKVRYVLIAGSSGSGKSVLAKRLELELRAHGQSALSISLDAFYKPASEIPLTPDGKSKDWNHPKAIDSKKFQGFLQKLSQKGQAKIPYYSFELNATLPDGETLFAKNNTVFLIEGLHVFNQHVLPLSQQSPHLKIYVDTLLPEDPENFDFKLFRTIVRDYELRGRSLAQTFGRWQSATNALNQWILPLMNNYDPTLRFYNSFTIQEYISLKPRALALLLNALLQAKADFLENTPLDRSTLPYLGIISHLLRICTLHDIIST